MLDVLNSEEVNKSRRINQDQLFQLIEDVKRRENLDNEEDTILAYVAMGGSNTKGGYVDANKLIQIIKNDFEMTIDIE